MPQLEPFKGDYYLWKYLPNLALNAVFLGIFTALTAAHSWKLWKTKQWFCWCFVTGGVFELLGFAFRIYCRYDSGNLGLFIVSSFFLVLAPVFFSATLYMVYTRIIRAVEREDCSLITTRWSSRIFIISDIVILNIQGNAGGLTGSQTEIVAQVGRWMLVAGLLMHIFLFIGFLYLCAVFQRRFAARVQYDGIATAVPWRTSLRMLYMTSAGIMARNVFRTIEYILGNDGYLLANEWPLFAFDSALMIIVMIIFFIWYPDKLETGKGQATELRSRSDSAPEAM